MSDDRRKPINWQIVLLAMIAATPPTLVALGAFFHARDASVQSTATHQAVNSRLTEFMALIKSAATDAALLKERREEAEKLPNAHDKGRSTP